MTATATQPRTRKPALEIHGVCRWLLQLTSGPLGHAGILEIVVTRNGKPLASTYAVEEFIHNGQLDGYRLTRLDGKDRGALYDLDTDFRCDCPDATFCPERPGQCKHARALRAALANLA